MPPWLLIASLALSPSAPIVPGIAHGSTAAPPTLCRAGAASVLRTAAHLPARDAAQALPPGLSCAEYLSTAIVSRPRLPLRT